MFDQSLIDELFYFGSYPFMLIGQQPNNSMSFLVDLRVPSSNSVMISLSITLSQRENWTGTFFFLLYLPVSNFGNELIQPYWLQFWIVGWWLAATIRKFCSQDILRQLGPFLPQNFLCRIIYSSLFGRSSLRIMWTDTQVSWVFY